MWRWVLMGLWTCSIHVSSCFRVDGYVCMSDYWHSITCVLNISSFIPEGPPSLRFNHSFANRKADFSVSCPLVAKNPRYTCDCKVLYDRPWLSSVDRYTIEVCDDSGCQHTLSLDFKPQKNVQMSPPPELDVQHTAETFNITCKSLYETHLYIRNNINYELLLETPGSGYSRPFRINSPHKSLSIDKSTLPKHPEYCLKVRCKNSKPAIWSEWSKPTCWKNNEQEEQENIFVTLVKSLSPVCVFVGVLLFVFSHPAVRMKIKTLSHTPSPAPFFQPLFQQHKGNLQDWLSPPGKSVLAYQTEEILTTDAVTVEPKPTTKDPEENQVFLSPPVTQLTFTSYVGLPGMNPAPPPVTMVLPEDTPYTQLPCSIWGFGIVEVEVVSPPPTDFLEVSQADSGCSCEDLSQSPECSLPNSPADERPPPCYCSDYCVLNKTAEGVVPVLVSKGSGVDSLQKDGT